MLLVGLLITRDDEAIFETWCHDQLHLYDAVVCLDGSTTDATRRTAERFRNTLVYLHENDFCIPHKTDHGLRRVVHQEIVRRFGSGHWIMCCHADEFCYHDPRKIVALAERDNFDLVSWYSPHFYPHPTELTDWDKRQHIPVPERHRHYHWGYLGSDLPWIEDRLYRDGPGIEWDDSTHGSVRPHGIRNDAPYHPIFRHFKVIATNSDWCEVIGGSTYYQHHWQGLEHRTGVPFRVERFEDLFVTTVAKYDKCDRFTGIFPQMWNMGEEYRPNQNQEGRTDRQVDGDSFVPLELAKEIASSAHDVILPNLNSQLSVRRLRIAIGPEYTALGSWNWLGVDLTLQLGIDNDVATFTDVVPRADVVVFFKFMPDSESLRAIRDSSAIIFCPVDVYGSAAEIDADAQRLMLCHRIVVHCERLVPYFQSYAPTSYMDHHVKYVIPTRNEIVRDGPVLWVGEQSNLSPLVEWFNEHELPADLVVLTNTVSTDAQEIGFHRADNVRVEAWTPEAHRGWLRRCRCAIDIKGSDFRAQHKPPAKALDFLASGVPLAMNRHSCSVDHLARMGFEIPDPENVEAWLSSDYAVKCSRFGLAVSELLSLTHIGDRWRYILRGLSRPSHQPTD